MSQELIKLATGRRGHFQTESGYHSDVWFDLDRLFDSPATLRPFVVDLASRLAPHRIDVVCGPVTGGAKLAELIAAELGISALFAERFESRGATELFAVRYGIGAEFRRSVRGKAVALVDDAISAGSAVRGTHADLLRAGARPVALGALFVFGNAAQIFAQESGLPLEVIAQLPTVPWSPSECPLCQQRIPLEPFPARNGVDPLCPRPRPHPPIDIVPPSGSTA